MEYIKVTPEEFAAVDGVDDWRVVLGTVQATFRAVSFPGASALISAIAAAAEAADHHPDIDMRYPNRVRVVLTTHATGGLSTLDVQLAREISALAAHAGATNEPTVAQGVEMAIDTMDADRIRPFWAAVLGYKVVDGNVVDPLRIGPPMWFQTITERRAGKARFHVDVSVTHDAAEARVGAALAAGGTLISDRFARSWWTLADADGNEACVCTWQDR